MSLQKNTARVSDTKAWAFSRKIFTDGMRDGFPIALGYFAVSFSLGIAARNAGLTPFQGFLAFLTMHLPVNMPHSHSLPRTRLTLGLP